MRRPVSCGLYFVFLRRRGVYVYLRACFLCAKKCFLRPFGAYLFLRVRVAYLFALMLPFCDEVFSMPVWHVSRFAPMLIEYASMACSTRSIYICRHVSFLRRSVFFMRVSLFCVFFLCVSRIISLLNLSTCHRGYTIADLFISRLRLQNGCATQRDVCEHIYIQIRSLCGDTISGPLNVFEQLYLKRTVTDTINWLAVKQ